MCVQVVAVTVQGVPETVQPPTVTALSAVALRLSWVAPRKPNGIIREYQISQMGKGLIYTDTAGKMQHTVSGKDRKLFKQNVHLLFSIQTFKMLQSYIFDGKSLWG